VALTVVTLNHFVSVLMCLLHPPDSPHKSFFSSLKTERIRRKTYRTRDEARADVFDYIEHFYNPKRRHSTIGYLSPMEFESQVGLA
jgi:transposase InsO family protein